MMMSQQPMLSQQALLSQPSMMTAGPSSSRHVTGEYVQSTRKKSSTIVDEQYLSPLPTDYPTREIEVQGPVQEVIKHVTRKEIVEREKYVSRPEIEWTERVVYVPKIEYVDKVVEVPHFQEVIREVKVPQIVQKEVEYVREVRKPVVNYVEKQVEVPGQIIEVPKPYTVEKPVHVNRYNDKQVPLVVAQTIRPFIVEGSGTVEVDVVCYEPECIPIDIHVPRPVAAQIQTGGIVESTHRVITVPAPQYNTILQQLNTHLTHEEVNALPFMRDVGGQVSFLHERVQYTQPQPGVSIIGWNGHQSSTITTTAATLN
eukprot:Gregarina_sp_Poly_1__7934@NODE_452_length_8287_cov_521_171290_g369_i0_p4_GENE_NODE_452_length_8287_cov_521_171290_g369_i0NODE_452_length_8287_cov_521_171290_g369_i0_p4_ORF_typecomplete_len314_score43_62IMCp/PF12314_8/0_39IMCp/PF12314_8/1_8e06IMCp/PF12314_8/0_04IMCp/PF12314_8/1_9e03_NODE_452_length_8287_cov_521_171290_g369_i072808221